MAMVNSANSTMGRDSSFHGSDINVVEESIMAALPTESKVHYFDIIGQAQIS
jgi:hypothetical protein